MCNVTPHRPGVVKEAMCPINHDNFEIFPLHVKHILAVTFFTLHSALGAYFTIFENISYLFKKAFDYYTRINLAFCMDIFPSSLFVSLCISDC